MTDRLAVFASGAGSNFAAIVDAIARGQVDAELALLFCDVPDAPVLKRPGSVGMKTVCFRPADCASRADYEERLLTLLEEHQIDLVALAGYMRIVGSPLLKVFGGRILNLHPSLLPEFPGSDAIGQALDAGAVQTGVTVHFIDEGIDTGPVASQRAVPIEPGDDRAALEARIRRVEHELYPQVIQQVVGGLL